MSVPRFLASLLLVMGGVSVASALDDSVLETEAARIALIEKTKQSVVAIFATEGEGGGSGVLISSDGYALTNFHVARPCGNWLKCGLPDGRVYDAVIVGIDPVGDLALIKLLGRNDFPAAVFGDSDLVQVGDWAYVMGNPFLLAADFQPTVTYGIISGVHRYQYPSDTLLEYADCLQTDASINPGNSGGPLFDADGKLIGIVGRGSFEKRGRVNVGAGYAISINQAKNFLGYLRSGRIVDHATLGATVALDEDGHVVVNDILQSSDAYRRGLRYDDELVALAGRAVETPNGFKNILGTLPKGWRVPLSFRREGQRYDVLVRLSGVHGEGELLEKLERSSNNSIPIPHRDPDKEKEPKEAPAPIQPKGNGKSAEQAMPDSVRRRFEERPGYANYYFNRLNRDRVLDGWRNQLKAVSQTGAPWIFTGSTAAESRFRLELSNEGVSLELPAGRYDWTVTDDLSQTLEPEGSGGMFPALYLWRQLALSTPDEFGEVHYLGTAPYPDSTALVDVVVAIRGGVEGRFFFAPDDHRLVGLEMWPTSGDDPCEIRFADAGPAEGLPRRIDVYYGDSQFAGLTIDAVE